jgi:hypothetical protein
MTAPVRQYVAMFVVGLVAAGMALGLLLLSRLVQPGSRIVRRGLLPRPWQYATAWARSNTLRLWCPDPAVEAGVAAHLAGPSGRRLARAGVSLATEPAVADVVVTRADADLADADRQLVCPPWSWVRLVDPTDVAELDEAMRTLAATLRTDRTDRLPAP